MNGLPHSHVGIIVEDLEAAIARFSDVLQIPFNDPINVHVEHLRDPDDRPVDFRVSYSKVGPPFYELVEGDGRGLYAMPPGGEGFHHIGVWQPDIQARMDELAGKDVTLEAKVMLEDGSLFACFNHGVTMHGIRFEFVDDADRETKEAYMRNGGLEQPFDTFDVTEPGQFRM